VLKKATTRRSKRISVAKALRIIRQSRPETPKDFRRAGLQLTFLGRGVFREVCKVRNCDLVVKFPLDDKLGDSDEGKEHSLAEIRRVRRLNKFRVMRRHLPKIYYYDKDSGVLVMHYYPKFTTYEAEADAMGQMIQELIKSSTRVRCTDIHSENVHVTRMGDAVVIDFGY